MDKMNNMKDMVFCQSCGMPMTAETEWGTEKDGTQSQDYCSYCYKNGQFDGDMTMEEMIAFCAPMTAQHTGQTEEAVKSQMNEYFPKLKRWAK